MSTQSIGQHSQNCSIFNCFVGAHKQFNAAIMMGDTETATRIRNNKPGFYLSSDDILTLSKKSEEIFKKSIDYLMSHVTNFSVTRDVKQESIKVPTPGKGYVNQLKESFGKPQYEDKSFEGLATAYWKLKDTDSAKAKVMHDVYNKYKKPGDLPEPAKFSDLD